MAGGGQGSCLSACPQGTPRCSREPLGPPGAAPSQRSEARGDALGFSLLQEPCSPLSPVFGAEAACFITSPSISDKNRLPRSTRLRSRRYVKAASPAAGSLLLALLVVLCPCCCSHCAMPTVLSPRCCARGAVLIVPCPWCCAFGAVLMVLYPRYHAHSAMPVVPCALCHARGAMPMVPCSLCHACGAVPMVLCPWCRAMVPPHQHTHPGGTAQPPLGTGHGSSGHPPALSSLGAARVLSSLLPPMAQGTRSPHPVPSPGILLQPRPRVCCEGAGAGAGASLPAWEAFQ